VLVHWHHGGGDFKRDFRPAGLASSWRTRFRSCSASSSWRWTAWSIGGSGSERGHLRRQPDEL